MVIERDARRFVSELIGSLANRTLFIKAIGQLNAVANLSGQGRQDFDPELLQLAT